MFLIFFSTEADDWLQVFRIILEELIVLTKKKINSITLKNTLEFIQSSIELDTEDTMNVALHYGIQSMLKMKPIETFDNIIEKRYSPKNITKQKILEACQEVFVMEKMCASVISSLTTKKVYTEINSILKKL